ncbi:MAG: ParB/RepB/Spo0J family partition protein [Ruminococcaceae bacterium]|nr:ParB/RepB/Spo0J family partition protein [Oscillospiraceae bacterium]
MRRIKEKRPYAVEGQVWQIPTGEIRPNPAQPRKEFPLDKLVELAQSISENGILQPLTVSFEPEGPTLVAGERRLRAARIAGLATVPCVEVQAELTQRRVLALVENMQRQDMNCFEEAEGIRELITSCELTQSEAAQQLGYSQAAVANKLRLLRLPEELRRRLVQAGLTERHARALLRLTDRTQREQAAARIIGERLTVAQTERLVEEMLAGRVRRRPSTPLVRDLRLFFNTVDHAVDVMRRGGFAVESNRREEEEYIEYVVRIPKSRDARH